MLAETPRTIVQGGIVDMKRIVACVLAASLLAPVIGLAQDSDTDRSHPAQFVKDSAITAAIKTKLAAEHPGSLAHLKVDTDKNGVVWLSGTTRSREEANKAVEIARGTDGVVRVRNDIVVRPDDK
jgi:hyperosmotically inducible periplasmic protein